MKKKQCSQTGCKNTPGKKYVDTKFCGIHAPKEEGARNEPIQMEASSLAIWEKRIAELTHQLELLEQKLEQSEKDLADHEESFDKSIDDHSEWVSTRSCLEQACEETQLQISAKEIEVSELNGKIRAGIPVTHTVLTLSASKPFLDGSELGVLENGKFNVWLKVSEHDQVNYLQADEIVKEYINRLSAEANVLYAQGKRVMSIAFEARGLSNTIEPQVLILENKGSSYDGRVETFDTISN